MLFILLRLIVGDWYNFKNSKNRSKGGKTNKMKNVTRIMHDGVIFAINEEHSLTEMVNRGNIKDVTIPKKFPNGEYIKSISPFFCFGEYGTITIANGIRKVCEKAFYNSDVVKVVWPSGCRIIPNHCFYLSSIKIIDNIKKVESIEQNAFRQTNITEFNWPANCAVIPSYCFYMSELRYIRGIDNVSQIRNSAFSNSNIEELPWPTKCSNIPEYCFAGSRLKKLTNLGCASVIERGAFKNASCVDELDFSSAFIESIAQDAFEGINAGSVYLPYYIDCESQ